MYLADDGPNRTPSGYPIEYTFGDSTVGEMTPEMEFAPRVRNADEFAFGRLKCADTAQICIFPNLFSSIFSRGENIRNKIVRINVD